MRRSTSAAAPLIRLAGVLVACGLPQPDALLAQAPVIYLDDRLDQAVVTGSAIPIEPRPAADWRFDGDAEWRLDGPQPAWKPAEPWNPTVAAAEVERLAGALRVTLTEAARNPNGIPVGGLYVDVPGWGRDEWAEVVVRARSTGAVARIGLRYNLREGRGTATDFPNPFQGGGTDLPVIGDGEVHEYRLPLELVPGAIRQLGLWFSTERAAGSIDLLSVAVEPADRLFRDAPFGLRTVRGRPSVYVHAPARIAYRVRVPADALLDVGLATFERKAPVTFRVRVEPEQGADVVVHEERWTDDGFWVQRSVDLSSFAGQDVHIVLEAEAAVPGTVAFWREPTLAGGRAARAASTSSCERLPEVPLGHATITDAQRVTSGSLGTLTDLPAFCRVAGVLRPTHESEILFEVWLPLATWNGRFSVVGNGGWAGNVSTTTGGGFGGYGLAEQLRLGYASASSNTGHRARPGLDAGRFAFDHPERLVDFAYRAQHETTVAAKALVQAFYGRAPEHSYYIGASSGGYQGLMEAQRFPDDFDGVMAGMPANNWTRLMAGLMNAIAAVVTDPGSHLSRATADLLHRAVLAECDGADGVLDGVLENPTRCAFDPRTLACAPGQEPGACLSPGQVEAVRRVYGGFTDPTTGEQLFPGFARGSEPFWPGVFNPAAPFPIPLSHYKWLVMADSTWDWRTFDFADPQDWQAFVRGEDKLAGIMNATSPDLTAFRRKGGKLLHWHGWTDQLIAPRNSIDYFESVLAFMGGSDGRRDAELEDVQTFYRLFMIPGLPHQPPDADFQAALERWVERGVAPESLMTTPSAGATSRRGRLLCPYPQVALYLGEDPNQPSSFRCAPGEFPRP